MPKVTIISVEPEDYPFTLKSRGNKTRHYEAHETCGQHTFKNALLLLLKQQKVITQSNLERLAKDKNFFLHVIGQIQEVNDMQQGGRDLSPPHMLQLLQKAKEGKIDLTEHGIKTEDLKKLNITQGDAQDLSVINCCLFQGTPEYACTSMDTDLLCAAAIAKLAKIKGPISHTFAFSINNKHWITVGLDKDINGELSWTFMDSENSHEFNSGVMDKINTVLDKTSEELNQYLLSVYSQSMSSMDDLIVSMYHPEEVANTEHLEKICNNFAFMQAVGWLTDAGSIELMHMQKYKKLIEGIKDSNKGASNSKVFEDKLTPIILELGNAISTLEAKGVNATEMPTEKPVNDSYQSESETSNQAYTTQTPNPSPTFMDSIVNAIKYLLDKVSEVVEHVMQAIGIKS